MRKILQLIVLLSVIVFFAGCSAKENEGDKHSDSIAISGQLKGAEGRTLYLHHLSVDTLSVGGGEYIGLSNNAIQGGNFSLVCKPENDEPAFYRIGFSAQNSITTLAKRGENINIKFTKVDTLCREYTVTGGKDAQLMCELDQHLSCFIDSAEQLLLWYEFTDDDSVHATVNNAYNIIKGHYTSYLRDFIAKNPKSLATMAAFYQKYQNSTFFDEARDLALLEQIYKNLRKAHPKNENVVWLSKRISFIKENLKNEQNQDEISSINK